MSWRVMGGGFTARTMPRRRTDPCDPTLLPLAAAAGITASALVPHHNCTHNHTRKCTSRLRRRPPSDSSAAPRIARLHRVVVIDVPDIRRR